MSVDTKKALEVAQYPWRVEQGGRYSLPSMDEVGYVVGTIKELVDEVERLRNEMGRRHRVDTDTIVSLRDEVERLRMKHDALLAAGVSYRKEVVRLEDSLANCEKP